MDLDGNKGQRHTKSIDGTYVPTVSSQRCMELDIIIKKSIKSTFLARSTKVDVFGKDAIILT
tara:strand:- start:194 stop:379 length:186 start_codon:yes stop_codon:yes gene_type:complete